MGDVDRGRPSGEMQAVALKAFSRIADAWSLTSEQAASLADMTVMDWLRANESGHAGRLSWDQMQRLALLIALFRALETGFGSQVARSWVKLRNSGPEFAGRRPIDAMVTEGLPGIERVHAYMEAANQGY